MPKSQYISPEELRRPRFIEFGKIPVNQYRKSIEEEKQNFSSEDFISGTIAVHKADVQLKSSRLPGKLNEWVVLEEVVQQLCPK